MRWAAAVASTLLLLIAIAGAQLQYEGNLYWQFMPSDAFGIPEHLKDKYQTWFQKPHLGWDGQFHFHIAQDLFNQKNTSIHVDNPPYRYKRIGLPLWSRLIFFPISTTSVSPFLYLFAHAIFIFLALKVIASYLEKNGLSSWWVLGWSLSLGTVTTFIHGLSDPMADAGMLAGFVCYLQKKQKPAIFFFTFAALSREYTILIPATLFAIEFTQSYWKNQKFPKDAIFLLFPLIPLLAWHLWVHISLGPLDPKTYSYMLDFPLRQFFLRITRQGNKLGALVVLTTVFPILYFWIKAKDLKLKSFFPIIILTLSTGPVVWVYYRDVVKTFSYCLLLAPIVMSFLSIQDRKRLQLISMMAFVIHFGVLIKLQVDEYRLLPRTCQSCTNQSRMNN